MKKGLKIQITESSNYSGQDMDWTEPFTGLKTIAKGGEWVCHTSQELIKEFRSKKICVTPNNYSQTYFVSNSSKKEVVSEWHKIKFLYSFFLPEGTIVETYSEDEYRFDLDNSFEVVFSGKILRRNGGKKIGNGNKEVYFDLVFSDTTKPLIK
jgi:hypothetical protein